MAKKVKKGKDSKTEGPKPVIETVGTKLREANGWFEEAAAGPKKTALSQKKAKLRATGKELDEKKLAQAWKLLRKLEYRDKIAKKLIKIVRDKLASHYAHLKEEKWENVLKEALAWPSYSLGINQVPLEEKLDEASWANLTRRYLEVQIVLAMIATEKVPELRDKHGKIVTAAELRKLICDNIVVSESPSITVAAPSKEGEAAMKQAAMQKMVEA